LAALVGVGAFVLWPREYRITRQNFDRIMIGMNRAAVEAIVGTPGDYSTGLTTMTGESGPDCWLAEGRGRPTRWVYWGDGPSTDYAIDEWFFNPDVFDGQSSLCFLGDATGDQFNWLDDAGALKVRFDEGGMVKRKEFVSIRRVEQAPFDNLLWRAKRLWRKWVPE
jgi:hypothetical protein